MSLSVHMHLMYRDVGATLLQRLSQVWSGKLHLSLLEDAESNGDLIKEAEKHFDLDLSINPNKESDQYGFYKSFARNKEESDLILYLHDKSQEHSEWLNDISENFLVQKNMTKSLDFMGDYNTFGRAGVVSSSKRCMQVLSPREISYMHDRREATQGGTGFAWRAGVVRLKHTANWIEEFQYILHAHHGLKNRNHCFPKNFYFTAGTVFLARRDVVQLSHDCVHENFFEDHYRTDGNVSHGMERLYYYASLCLGYKNVFWQPDGTEDLVVHPLIEG